MFQYSIKSLSTNRYRNSVSFWDSCFYNSRFFKNATSAVTRTGYAYFHDANIQEVESILFCVLEYWNMQQNMCHITWYWTEKCRIEGYERTKRKTVMEELIKQSLLSATVSDTFIFYLNFSQFDACGINLTSESFKYKLHFPIWISYDIYYRTSRPLYVTLEPVL